MTDGILDEDDRLEQRHRELFDAETGLAGALLLLDRVGVSLARARRFNRWVLVVWFEIRPPEGADDREAVRRIADGLLGSVRPDDSVARLSTWEFVVLCNDLAHESAVGRIVRRLHATVRHPAIWRGAPADPGPEPLVQIGTALGRAQQHPRTLLAQARASLRPARPHAPA
jgi:hypothetical protein